MRIFLLVASIFCFIKPCFADYTSLCKEIEALKKGVDLVKNIGKKRYVLEKLATPVNGKFIIGKFREQKWIVFDVRSKKSLIKFGKIGNTIDIVSAEVYSPKNKFTVSNLMGLHKSKKNLRYLKKRGILNFKHHEDLQEYNYIVFCNGHGCHRSSFAACQLRKIGIPFNQIYIGLGGVNELIENGASFR